MTTPGRFPSSTVALLAKRAGTHCSNPDCGALTSGPSADADDAINLGEAAHIFGLTPDSARYDARLTVDELADITNGIWLCRNCHKLIDDDDERYTSDLLFMWRRLHDEAIVRRLGRPGDLVAAKLTALHLKPFEDTSNLAQQIVLDKPEFWEHKLTIELLRSELGDVHDRWRQLKNGLYFRRTTALEPDAIGAWFTACTHDATQVMGAIAKLVNEELAQAWGPPGQPGSDAAILRTCRLIVAAAKNLLEWEEDLRFSRFPPDFQELKELWTGVVGSQIDELMRATTELAEMIAAAKLGRKYDVTLTFQLPEGFIEQNHRVWRRCARRVAGMDPDLDPREIWWKIKARYRKRTEATP